MQNPRREALMRKAFICYRRETESDFARRLAEYLRTEFGKESAYFDRTSNVPGKPWPSKIKEEISLADTFLLVIGPDWLRMQDANSGRRKIDIKSDWVRQELVSFLSLEPSTTARFLVPVLVGDAAFPKEDHLDGALKRIADLEYIKLQDTGSRNDFLPLRSVLLKRQYRPLSPPPAVTPVLGRLPTQLSDADQSRFVEEHPDWRIEEREKPGAPGDLIQELYRMYEFANYEDAWKFMTAVDEQCIRRLHHHPRWQNTYNRVELWLTTFNIGHKPSRRDARLANCVEEVWRAAQATSSSPADAPSE
jgi:4a-hydroxytetrahydrobiopterin dehydratase